VFAIPALVLAGCGSSPGPRAKPAGGSLVLHVSAIPDQDPQLLQRQYGAVSEYLSTKLGVAVTYVPVTDYTASVTAFRRGDLDLVFFGGLTGVQARLQVPGAKIVAQRDIDAEFRTVFVANKSAGVPPITGMSGLAALAGHSFTYGSESSTSGRLMPAYFLSQAGVAPTAFKGQAGFSGSHDKTIKLVEAGTYETGALNSAVWDDRVTTGKVDVTKVVEVFRTPAYHDYHWLIRPDVDDRLGAGVTQRVADALLGVDGTEAQETQILELFHCKGFITAKPEDYAQIESVGRTLGLIK
ncbi:MAG TPA: putative selenate ABC transporter substrate-binding protein, partial [Micromonosporaceae bacterium]|nr:putative selenate ABC transporter substrate-binding protein [Micromonosporaceae bacterium]